MELLNKTNLSTEFITTSIIESSKLINCDLDSVLFKFVYSKKYFLSAYTENIVQRTYRRLSKEAILKRKCTILVVINIPEYSITDITEYIARYYTYEIIKCILHELSHVKDFKLGIKYDAETMKKRWKNRWYEKKAIKNEELFNNFNNGIIDYLVLNLIQFNTQSSNGRT